MVKLKKLLSDDLKILRHRRLILNIQITTLTWMLESVLSFLVIVVSLLGVDSKHKVFSFLVPELMNIVYAVLNPALTLINDTELKDYVIQNDWYISILDKLGWTYKGPMREEINTDKSSPADTHSSREFEGNEVERNLECEDAEEIDRRSSNILRESPKVRSIPHSEINDTTIPRKSYHSKDLEITDLEVSNSNA